MILPGRREEKQRRIYNHTEALSSQRSYVKIIFFVANIILAAMG